MSADHEQRFYPEIEMRERDVPCWYEISWQKNPQSLLLKIHQDFIQNTMLIPPNAPIIKALSESSKLSGFGADFSKDIGFENVFKNKGSDERGMIVYQAEIPEVRKVTDKPCSYCHGTKYNEELDNDCLRCEKTGKEILIDWQPAYTLSASLTAITIYLQLIEKETSATFPQLLTLQTCTDHELHGGSLNGVFGSKFSNFIKSQSSDILSQIAIPTTQSAYRKMLGKQDYVSEYSFRIFKLSSGGISLDCPGDACGIHPDSDVSYDTKNNRGYEYTCHNVDTPMQQITLIAGLAALHDCARKEIK